MNCLTALVQVFILCLLPGLLQKHVSFHFFIHAHSDSQEDHMLLLRGKGLQGNGEPTLVALILEVLCHSLLLPPTPHHYYYY